MATETRPSFQVGEFEQYESIGIECDGAPVASVWNYEDFPCADEDQRDQIHAEAIDVARKMAAAPDLYAALQALLARVSDVDVWVEEIAGECDAARAALAKADGR